MGQLFNVILVQPIINILVAIYHMLIFFHVPFALGFAIILLTILIRILLYPFTAAQLRTQQKMQSIQPHLSKIKEKHKGDAKRQQEATMALYREHNINPAAGCLPGIVQIVILLFGFYPALQEVIALNPKNIVMTINHAVYFPFLRLNSAWDTSFFGLSLGKNPGQLLSSVGLIIILIPLITGLLQFIQSKMMMPAKAEQPVVAPKPGGQEDFAVAFQKQSLYLVPVMIGFFSYRFPIGLSLYWNTFTLFGIIQQYRMQGLGSLGDLIKKAKDQK